MRWRPVSRAAMRSLEGEHTARGLVDWQPNKPGNGSLGPLELAGTTERIEPAQTRFDITGLAPQLSRPLSPRRGIRAIGHVLGRPGGLKQCLGRHGVSPGQPADRRPTQEGQGIVRRGARQFLIFVRFDHRTG